MANLPNSSSKLTIANFDDALETEAQKCRLESLRFIDAYGLVGTASAIRAQIAEGREVEVIPPSRAAMREHLTAMGFSEFLQQAGHRGLGIDKGTFETSGVVVPLRSAGDAGGEQAISQILWNQLQDHVDSQVLAALAEGVWEMVANGLEHSGSDALVMAQVYRTTRYGAPPDHDDKVQVVIGDTGRGIRDSLASSPDYDPEDDLQAISLALEYLVSSVHDDPGRGQGLSTTLEQVSGLDGKMVIRSGRGKTTIAGGDRLQEMVPWLPGTIVALSLPLYPG
jgi:hypothetical protein